MPYRKTLIVNNEVYHVLNRSVASQIIFKHLKDYRRFIDLVDFYRFEKPQISFSRFKELSRQNKESFLKNLRGKQPLIEIVAFCLMPNHFHFLLRQTKNKGISEFMSNIQNSYAKYFNIKYDRSGSLFQSMFKVVRIEKDEQLLHVSRYIHLNPSSANLVKVESLPQYEWSSLNNYVGENVYNFVSPELVLDFFETKGEYWRFLLDRADYQKRLQEIKDQCLE